MNRTHKIKAFTLVEVLVTMAISSLVIIMAYSTFSLTQNYFTRVEANNSFNAECLSFRLMMSKDIDAAQSIKASNNEIVMDIGGEEISWSTKADTIIREADSKFEFPFKPHQFNIVKDKETGYVDFIKLTFAYSEEDSIAFKFYKKYPIAIYVNK